MELPAPIKKLASELAALPSIGPRQATRMAFHLAHEDPTNIRGLAAAVEGLSRLTPCERCFLIHDGDDRLCSICKNGARNERVVMVVEKETDLVSLENTGRFKGRYLVVGDLPRAGVLAEEQRRRLASLAKTLAALPDGKAEEIILAFDPTNLGDFHASLVAKELAPYAQKMTRLGRGLPSGGEIEFADDETLGSAFEGRA